VDVDAVKAAYANGLLEITLPKHPEAKPRKIDVSVG
jgi:HSP20 family molecular chaperone IbpA